MNEFFKDRITDLAYFGVDDTMSEAGFYGVAFLQRLGVFDGFAVVKGDAVASL
jgi:hypothetical protein